MSAGMEEFVETSNVAFGVLFLVEIVVRLVGLGVHQFFRGSFWNPFDLAIVTINFTILLIEVTLGSSLVDVNLLRVCRVVRIVRLVKTSARLRSLFKTLVLSLPSLANVGTLLLLLLLLDAAFVAPLPLASAAAQPRSRSRDLHGGLEYRATHRAAPTHQCGETGGW